MYLLDVGILGYLVGFDNERVLGNCEMVLGCGVG